MNDVTRGIEPAPDSHSFPNSPPLPKPRDGDAVARPAARGLAMVLDRTAVLVAGLVAGFVVGQSFVGPAALPAPAPVALPQAAPTSNRADAPLPRQATLDPRVVGRVRADGRLRVGVFGDSFGNGIWEALYRQLPRDDGFEVLRFSKEATGFTRYRTLDLEKRALEQLARDPVDVSVVSFGANDAFPLYDDGHLYPLMSEGWQRVIGARVDRFVAAVRSTGATVYWVGLPVMRNPVLNAQMQAMDQFYAQHMRALGVTFIDTRPLSVDTKGQYNAYLPDEKGVPRLMRTGDGLHMIGVGYQRLTAGVAADVRTLAGRARDVAGRPR